MQKKESVKKKKWVKPSLIILTRGRPEEGALAACKVGMFSPGGPGWAQTACYLALCSECSVRTAT